MILSEEFHFKPYMKFNAGEPSWLSPDIAGGWCLGVVEDWMVDALTGAEPWSGNLDSRIYAAQSRQRAFQAHLDVVRTVAKHKRQHPSAATDASAWEQLVERARRSGAMQGGLQRQEPSSNDPQFAAGSSDMHSNIEAHEAFSRKTRRLKGLACTIAYAANPADLYQRVHAAVTLPRSAGLMIAAGGARPRAPSERWLHAIGYAPWRDGGKRIIDICSAQWRFEDGTANDTVARYIERYVARAGVTYWPGKADVLCVITYHPPGPGTGVELLTAEPIRYRPY